jgi:hypothetical protein
MAARAEKAMKVRIESEGFFFIKCPFVIWALKESD